MWECVCVQRFSVSSRSTLTQIKAQQVSGQLLNPHLTLLICVSPSALLPLSLTFQGKSSYLWLVLAARWCWNLVFECDPDPVRNWIFYSCLLNFLFVPIFSSSRMDRISLCAPPLHLSLASFSSIFFNEPLDRFHVEIMAHLSSVDANEK